MGRVRIIAGQSGALGSCCFNTLRPNNQTCVWIMPDPLKVHQQYKVICIIIYITYKICLISVFFIQTQCVKYYTRTNFGRPNALSPIYTNFRIVLPVLWGAQCLRMAWSRDNNVSKRRTEANGVDSRRFHTVSNNHRRLYTSSRQKNYRQRIASFSRSFHRQPCRSDVRRTYLR